MCRLLVVDDGKYQDLNHHLSKLDQRIFEVNTVDSIAQLKNRLRNLVLHDRPYPEIILLNLYLPDSRGIETLNAARPLSPSSTWLVISGSLEQGLRAIENGASDFLIRGSDAYNYQILDKTLRSAMIRHQHRQNRGGRKSTSLQKLHNLVSIGRLGIGS